MGDHQRPEHYHKKSECVSFNQVGVYEEQPKASSSTFDKEAKRILCILTSFRFNSQIFPLCIFPIVTRSKLASLNDQANTEFPRNQISVLHIDFVRSCHLTSESMNVNKTLTRL